MAEPNDRGGWTVKETDTHYVDVIPMIFNDRICLTPKAAPEGYDYGWCYDQGGAALLAALVWDPDTEPEPAGFKKRIARSPRTLPAEASVLGKINGEGQGSG